MFGDFALADRIAVICSHLDYECRREMSAGTIVDERDYVSNLTSKIRNAFKNQRFIDCYAQTLPSDKERKFGVDGIMVFKIGNEFKVGIFEAKRPKVKVEDYPWDYLSKRKISHLSEQIDKQRIWKDELAVWEMFFNEADYGFESPPYDYFGSSCVWHENAYSYMNSEALIFTPWTTEKLKKLLKNSGVNFYSIIYDIMSCRAGKIIRSANPNSLSVFSSINPDTFLEIPIPTNFNIDSDERVSEFLLETGIESYLFVDMSVLKKRISFGI